MRTILKRLAGWLSALSVRFDIWLDAREIRRDIEGDILIRSGPYAPAILARTKRVPTRTYDRAQCEHCGKSVAIRRDGEPHARRHKCHVLPPDEENQRFVAEFNAATEGQHEPDPERAE
jgi:hypothetical protein